MSQKKIKPSNSQMADATDRLLTSQMGRFIRFVPTVDPRVLDVDRAPGAS